MQATTSSIKVKKSQKERARMFRTMSGRKFGIVKADREEDTYFWNVDTDESMWHLPEDAVRLECCVVGHNA